MDAKRNSRQRSGCNARSKDAGQKPASVATMDQGIREFTFPDGTKYHPLKPLTGNMPEELRKQAIWVVWKCTQKPETGAIGKVPFSPVSGHNASSTCPSTWGTFEEAWNSYSQKEDYAGIGIMLPEDGDLVGIDLDHCYCDYLGELDPNCPWAEEIVSALDTYTELSPSGEGVRLLARGKLPPGGRRKGGIEVYGLARFLTLTGHILGQQTGVTRRQDELATIHAKFLAQGESVTANALNLSDFTGLSILSDEEVIEQASKAANGEKFKALFHEADTSDYSGDQSRADMALCQILAFFCRRDWEQIERLFSASELGLREKWQDRADYRVGTIKKAIINCKEVFGPNGADTVFSPIEEQDQRPIVMKSGNGVEHLEMIKGTVEAILPHEELFVREGDIVRPVDMKGGYRFEPLTPTGAASELERYARFQKWRKGKDGGAEKVPAPLSSNEARIIIESPELKRGLPRIEHLADYPVPIMRDGKLSLTVPGYDATTKVYTDPYGPVITPLKSVKEATEALDDLLGGFCFALPPGNESLYKDCTLVYLLTAHCHLLFEPERTPLFYAGANRPGCGKDCLLGLAPVLMTGAFPGYLPPTNNQDETRKRLLALCLSGARFMLVSNCKGHLNDSALEQALTAASFTDRILGVSQTGTYPNKAIYAMSGNGLTYTEDLERRMVRMELEFLEDSIQSRTFKHPDLHGYALKHRARFLSALQTLVYTWGTLGCPLSTTTKASFTRWSQVLGGILEACGLANPIGVELQAQKPVDNDVDHMRLLLVAWEKEANLGVLSTKELRGIASRNELFTWLGDLDEDRSAQTCFGNILKRHSRRSFGGLRLCQHESGSRTQWRIERVNE